jgi:iron complex outermembrane receptor protein
MQSIPTRARRGALASIFIASALNANAQQPAASGSLEEIVVTAQKREQNSQDIGISLSAISGADLSSLGAVTATDITKSMPAVVLTQPNGPSSFSLAIRGVTQNDFADHQESPAAIYVDDVYVSQMAGLAFSLFDVDRVEVLRGPQGTLFGRNATGGLANFITRKPTDQDGGYVDVTFGQRNLMRIEGALNGAIVDGVDGRLSFESNHYDPLFHNTAGGAADAENGNDWAIRGQLLFKLPSNSELLLSARASREDVHAGSWEEKATKPSGNNDGVDVFVGPNDTFWGCAGCNGSGLTNSGSYTTRDNVSGYAKLETRGLTGKFTRDLGGPTLTVIGDYSKLSKRYQEDSDASPYTLFQFFNGSDVNQESLEARLNGGDAKLNWTGGLYGLRIDGKYYEGWQGPAFFTAQEFATGPNPNSGYVPGAWPYGDFKTFWTTGGVPGPDGAVPNTKAPYELVTKSYAAFGQLEYRLTDLIGFVVGARFTSDKKDYNFSWYPYETFPQSPTGATTTLTPTAGFALSTPYVGNRSDNLYSGKAQLDFHLSQDMLAYVSYNRGVKGGGFNAPLFPFTINDLSTLTFKPETLTSYEVGFKSEFLEHTLRLNAAAYYYNYKDYQALIYTSGLEQLIVNADATHKGAEAEVDWAPTSAWRFGAGLSYVDAIVKNVPGRCCTTDSTGALLPVVGDYTPGNAPRWTANVMARYTFPIGSGHMALQADGNYLSRFWFNLSDLPVVQQTGFGIANLRVNYAPQSGKLEVGASVENLADKHYGVMGFDNTSINGLAQIYPGMPRWFKVHANYKF